MGISSSEKVSKPAPAQVEKVASFREKPDSKTAKKFVAAGRFFWNAGMFFWKAETVLEALRQHQPKTWTLLAGLQNGANANSPRKLRNRSRVARTSRSIMPCLEKANECRRDRD